MKALIDTCVIMDAVQGRKPFQKDAELIFLAASTMLFDGFVSAKAMTDIFYLTHRLTHDNGKTRTVLGRIASLFTIVDTTHADIFSALASNVNDFEDAVMIATADRESMDCIVTRNLDDYTLSPVTVYSPEQFVTLLDLK